MSEKASVRFPIQFDQSLNVWVLHLGGSSPIHSKCVEMMLVDRSVTIAISKILARPNRTDMEVEKRWRDNLNSEHFLLNSVLYASEGETQQTPTLEAFRDDIAVANCIFARGLPEARTIHHDSWQLDKFFEIVIATAQRHQWETEFLIEVSPKIASRVSPKRTEQVECEIIEAAHSKKLSPRSFVVLAALSCLYEPQDGKEPKIGRGVIKPKPTHTYPKAYNALADIRSLEFLAAASGLSGPSAGFCTRDKYRAEFWMCLGVSLPKWDGNRFSGDLSPSSNLFPRLNEDEVQDLFSRLQ